MSVNAWVWHKSRIRSRTGTIKNNRACPTQADKISEVQNTKIEKKIDTLEKACTTLRY